MVTDAKSVPFREEINLSEEATFDNLLKYKESFCENAG
jgi:hypothetical protein